MPAGNILLLAGLLALPLLGQPSPAPAAQQATTAPRDEAAAGPATAAPAPGTVQGTPGPQDSLSGPKSRADTVLVVKHRFNHREQIITGSVVMTCLALMMVVMNNYNPR